MKESLFQKIIELTCKIYGKESEFNGNEYDYMGRSYDARRVWESNYVVSIYCMFNGD
jgi:hypothetical protein